MPNLAQKQWFAFLFAFGLFIVPAAAQKVRKVEYSKSSDFSSYRTYTWLPVKTLERSGIVENNPDFTPVVKEAISQQFAAKGLREAPAGGDLEVNVLAFRYSSPQLEALVFAGPPDAAWAIGGPTRSVGRYNEEGTLVVNLIDTRGKKSAWAALVTSSLDEKKKSPERVRKAVQKIFQYYPPKPKQ